MQKQDFVVLDATTVSYKQKFLSPAMTWGSQIWTVRTGLQEAASATELLLFISVLRQVRFILPIK